MEREKQKLTADFASLKAQVIDTGLCTRCGGCVGVCPDDALEFDDVLGDCLPQQKAECSDCGVCHTACSGGEVIFPELNQQVFGRQPDNMLLGQLENLQ